LAIPNYNIIYNIKNIKKKMRKNKFTKLFFGINYITLSRGCPYNCSYCAIPGLYKKFRKRSAKKIIDEIEYNLHYFKNRYFNLACESFTFDKKWAEEVCNEIIKRKLKIRFSINTRTDLVNEKIISLLKKAGCFMINFGIESGSNKILNDYDKYNSKFSCKQIYKISKMLEKRNIIFRSYIMWGNYKESLKDFLKTLTLLIKTRSANMIQRLDPYPGTSLYESYIKQKIVKKYWYVYDTKSNIHKSKLNLIIFKLSLFFFKYHNFYIFHRYFIKNKK
jgi:anaerobic magnesium-protoporphyrin IX monomethyl ester cyclase